MSVRIFLFALTLLSFANADDSMAESDDPPAWYFAEWTTAPTQPPGSSEGMPTFYPTPFNQNPGFKQTITTPSPTPFALNPSWKTELPTNEPTPLEWRIAKPTPYFMNPKFSTPYPSSFPTFSPTPFDLNPLFVSTVPTQAPSETPTPAPTPWPTPQIGASISVSCENIMNARQVYPSHLSTNGFQGLGVQYYSEYKIVTVLDKNRRMTSYVLYMCNPPDQKTLDDLGHIHANKYIKIPLRRVGYTDTYIAHALELLGLQPAIRAAGTPIEWLSSPCLTTLADNGEIAQAYNWDTERVDNEILRQNIEITFGSEREVQDGLYNGIEVPSQWYNTTALDSSLQLLGFLSLFFNQEGVANTLINNIQTNYKCSSKTARRNANPVTTRKVLWCDYGGKANIQAENHNNHNQIQTYSEDIWSCKGCPGPECSLVKDAGGKLLDYADFGDHTVIINGVQYLESTEFMEMAIFADVWINSGSDTSDFNDTINTLLEENYVNMPNGWLPISEIPAVRQKRVYDFYRRGYYASKQEMTSESDALLQDIYSVIASTGHDRLWLRNVFKEKIGMKSVGTCSGDGSSSDNSPWRDVLPLAQDCTTLEGTPFPTRYPARNPNGGSSGPTPTYMRTHSVPISTSKHISGAGVVAAKVIVGLLGAVVVLVISWFLYHTLGDQRKLTFAATMALGNEGKRMDMSTMATSKQQQVEVNNYQRYTQAAGDPYSRAPDDSDHGVVSSTHGGVVSGMVTPISGILGNPSPATRSAPDMDTIIRPIGGRGILGFLFPFKQNRNYSYN